MDHLLSPVQRAILLLLELQRTQQQPWVNKSQEMPSEAGRGHSSIEVSKVLGMGPWNGLTLEVIGEVIEEEGQSSRMWTGPLHTVIGAMC